MQKSLPFFYFSFYLQSKRAERGGKRPFKRLHCVSLLVTDGVINRRRRHSAAKRRDDDYDEKKKRRKRKKNDVPLIYRIAFVDRWAEL